MAKRPKKIKKKPDLDTGDGSDLLLEVLSAAGEAEGAQLLGSEGLAIKIRGIISTQIPGIDNALGRWGVPLSRLTILHGKEASGKTTLALHIVAECQRQGGIAVFIDVEYKLDPDYAKKLGVETERLIIVQPPHLERIFEIIDGIIDKAAAHREKTGTRTPILIVLDSMNASITKAELEGGFEDRHVAPRSRVFSNLLPRIIPKVSKEDVCLLFISQVRKKIGVMFGDDEEIAGGNAPKFYASVIAKVTKMGQIKDKKNCKSKEEEKRADVIASKIRVEIVKNQIAPPFKKAHCEIRYGKGIDKELSLINLAMNKDIIDRTGAWYSYDGKKFAQGIDKASEYLRENKDFYDEIMEQVKA